MTVDRRLPPSAGRDPQRPDNPVAAGSRPRQLRVKPAGLGGAGLAVVAFTVWWSGGPRLALFMSVAVGAMVVIDAVWASVATRRARVRFTSAPSDTVAGDVVALGVSVTGLHHPLLVRVGGAGPLLALPPAQGAARAAFPRRGVVTEVVIEVESQGLCGLVGHARRHTTPLPRPLAVGPRPENPRQPLPESSGAWSEGRIRPSPTGDVVRGLREYAPGDSARSVHWRATARFDDLMVKEVEEPGSRELILALDMGSGGDPGERAAAVAAWYAVEALQRGYRVVLATVEPSGPVTLPVRSSHDLNTRLAAAVPGRPETTPGRQEVLMVAAGSG